METIKQKKYTPEQVQALNTAREQNISQGIKANSGAGQSVATATQSTTNVAPINQVSMMSLTEPSTPISVPQPIQPTQPSNFVSNLQPAIQAGNDGLIRANTEEARQRDDLLGKLLATKTTSSQGIYNDAFEQQGGSETLKKLNDASTKLATLQGKFRTSAQEISGQRGQSKVQEGISLNELDRQSAIEVGNQALVVQALQGNFDTARQIAMDTSNFAIEDRKVEMQNLIAQLDAVGSVVAGQEAQLIQKDLMELEQTQTAINQAIQSGGASVEEMQQLTSLDVSDADKKALAQQITAKVTAADRGMDYQLKQLQLSNLRSQISERNSATTQKPLTAAQSLALGYGERMLQSSMIVDEIGSQFTGAVSLIGEKLPKLLKSEERQKYEQAQRNFINAVLRRESGAAIAPSEFASAELQYFPQPGDTEGTILQKKQNRDLVTKSVLRDGGMDTTQLDQSLQDPLGLGISPLLTDNPLNL